MTDDIQVDEVQLFARLVPRKGQELALRDAITAIVPAVLREPGCRGYTAHLSRTEPGTVVMYEVWKDQAALDAHATGENFTGLQARFDDLLGAPITIETLRRIT